MSQKTTVWILGDQLTPQMGALQGLDPSACVILLVESWGRGKQLPYSKQKLTFLWSAMRHFAAELRELGYRVDYRAAQPTFTAGWRAHLDEYQPTKLRLMESAEYGGSQKLAELVAQDGVAVEISPNTMFLSDKQAFQKWADGKKILILETFYRRMRRQTGLLMVNEKEPEGGIWNYDKENRDTPPPDHRFPAVPSYPPDDITREVMGVVRSEFNHGFGRLDTFWWPVSRAQAVDFFEDFLDHRLDMFGPYEDAIVMGERALYHSLISTLVNVGLLEPLEMCRRAEARYQEGRARLNSVEGFIRQLIGWREFMYQVYHFKMPGYLENNYFEADIPLPDFYWTGDTAMNCIADAVNLLREHGVNHHIQRLMITGNFALIAGLNPQQVNEWYWLAYTDAYEWVVSPNVLGMALYADGGVFSTKPYSASANYINKMSNCCRGCAYNHKQIFGDKACPFNALYWDFLDRNVEKLRDNPRMNLMLANLNKRDAAWMAQVRAQAADIRERLRQGERI